MIIKSIKLINYKGSNYKYNFSNNTMIFSKDNSKGKTTLIRFILYALGYSIPATEGIGSFDNIEFELEIEKDGKRLNVFRKNFDVRVFYEKKENTYKLPEQENDLHSIIFGIDNPTILSNLLATYYIDQEKGWTLLNRGKIIGNIRFNIEEFIAGISNIKIDELLIEKRTLNSEIKKYRYFKNAIDINAEFEDEIDDILEYNKYDMKDLLQEQKEYEIQLKKVKKELKKLEEIILTNKGFAEMIDNYGLLVKHNGEEFILTKDKLSDFDQTQSLLKIRLNNLKIKEIKLKKSLENILISINEKNCLFETEDLLETMQKSIENSGIDISQIDKILKQLVNKRNSINNQIKNKLSFNNLQLLEFYEIIVKYAKELGIFQFISDQSPKFVLTNKLKGLSGRVLAQLCFIFKLSYILSIEKAYGTFLPIIIDSPRTNELSEESTNDMMNILKRDFSKHQIITASIYKSSVINFDIMNLNNGLLSEDFVTNDK